MTIYFTYGIVITIPLFFFLMNEHERQRALRYGAHQSARVIRRAEALRSFGISDDKIQEMDQKMHTTSERAPLSNASNQ